MVKAWQNYTYRVSTYRDLGDWVLTRTDVKASGPGGIPVEMRICQIWQVRDGPTMNLPISSSGFWVADSPIRFTSRPAAAASRSSVNARWARTWLTGSARLNQLTFWAPCLILLKHCASIKARRMWSYSIG